MTAIMNPPLPPVTREELDEWIESMVRAKSPTVYDCDDPYDDCQDWVDEYREELREKFAPLIQALS